MIALTSCAVFVIVLETAENNSEYKDLDLTASGRISASGANVILGEKKKSGDLWDSPKTLWALRK